MHGPSLNRIGIATLLAALLASCGGSSNSPSPPPPSEPPPPAPPSFDPHYRVSAASPFAAGCEGETQTGSAFVNAEVEPHLSISPLDGNHLVGLWQQDRWSNGAARGLVSAVSRDGGLSWTRQAMAFSRCGGGNAGNGGDYLRATDPWLSFGPDGVLHAMSLSISGSSFQAGSKNAMLAARSTDGGLTWSNAATLILDGSGFFNDKNAITADPTDARYVYAVWDRLSAGGGGPAMLARSSDGGLSWEPARAIYDPGINAQTIGNVIAVLPDGSLLNLMTVIDGSSGQNRSSLAVLRSTDKGVTWSAPIPISDLLAIGASDPETGTAIRDGSILAQIAVAPSGAVLVVWQDARFSGGVRDGIALSLSQDGGLTWSAPQRVNRSPGVTAFMPKVHVRSDGMVGVTHFDLRSNTSSPANLPTDYWLVRSQDLSTWVENRVAGPFDLATAPNANGLFVGDYMGLESRGNVFVPFFVQANDGNTGNRTDVFAAPQVSVVSQVQQAQKQAVVGDVAPDPAWRARIDANIRRQIEQRVPGWLQRVEAARKEGAGG
ncbi:MAG TPA: sialidase family protein [Arenimonas sp.]|nr:sialidase family protein [Arenimonas sp.]